MKGTAIFAFLALIAAVVPIAPGWIETAYSSGVYTVVQRRLTSASNLVPFALFDWLLVVVAACWFGAVVRDCRRSNTVSAFTAALLRTVRWGAVAYLAFLVVWGLNYRRIPVQQRLQFDRASIDNEAVQRMAHIAVDRLNTLTAEAHRTGWPPTAEMDPALQEGVAEMARDLGLDVPLVARPKRTVFDWYFRRAGVEGMTDPFFLETLVVGDLLPFERPFVIAHEWSHLAGLGDESAASFAGWLACLRGSTADQYSGWLFVYQELAATMPRADRETFAAALGKQPRADLAASRNRVLANIEPRVSAAAWRAYDSYLKSNGVAAGMRSYDEVVQLVLGTRFDEAWKPQRRPAGRGDR